VERFRATCLVVDKYEIGTLVFISDEAWFPLCWNVGKGNPAAVRGAKGVPDRLRPRIFLTFGTTRLVGRHPYAPTAFTPGEFPGTHFQRLSRPQGTSFRQEPRKKSPVTPPGIDPETSRLVAQCLNHYATPRPCWNVEGQNNEY
jgi:hypothetical protein